MHLSIIITKMNKINKKELREYIMINQKYTQKKSKRRKKRRLKKRIKRMLLITATFLLFILLFSIVIFLPYQGDAQHLQESNTKMTTLHKNTEVSLNSEETSCESTTNASLNNNQISQDTESSQGIEPSEPAEPSNNIEPTQENTTTIQETIPETAPPSLAVENEYFNDAVFIGDSRTEGFFMYTDLANARAYAHKGLTVDTVFTDPVININGSKLPIIEALRQTSFQKVYIMLGVNETGWAYNSIFIEKYTKLVEEIQIINPNATIYLQSILPVSNEVSSTHDYIKNEKISEYNSFIEQIAKEKNVHYLNVSEAVASPNGALPDDAAVDGIHLKKEYCEKWLEYLKKHTI